VPVKRPELLSPAGDFESLKAAVLFGADAVYLSGEKYGLRVNAGFKQGEIIQAVEYAHKNNVKIYLACNIVANNADIDGFPEYIKEAANLNVDAVIVSDPGLFDSVKTHAPELPVHISTQAGVMNYAAANALYKAGAKRVILARETSLSEIKAIRGNTPPGLELEAFVHGAMCVSFSGRCLLSAYMNDRHANRGECTHPCRWKYSLYHLEEETRPGEYFDITETNRGSYILNSKDLCMIEHIGEMAESGLTSLKIEGRAKTAYYTAVITNAYRAAIDAYANNQPLPDWARREVDCVSHRPYCAGFYLGNAAEMNYETSGYIRECDFIATVDKYNCADGAAEITQRGYFTASDYIEVVQPFCEPERVVISEMFNAAGEPVKVANHAMEKLFIKCGNTFKQGAVLRRCHFPRT